jgi:hypothetical protein
MLKKERAPHRKITELQPARRLMEIAVESAKMAGADLYRLMNICVVLLETCIHSTGKVDPVASRLIALARAW